MLPLGCVLGMEYCSGMLCLFLRRLVEMVMEMASCVFQPGHQMATGMGLLAMAG